MIRAPGGPLDQWRSRLRWHRGHGMEFGALVQRRPCDTIQIVAERFGAGCVASYGRSGSSAFGGCVRGEAVVRFPNLRYLIPTPPGATFPRLRMHSLVSRLSLRHQLHPLGCGQVTRHRREDEAGLRPLVSKNYNLQLTSGGIA